MRVGVRVVRGPHWRWEDQDGGEGSVGTVVDLPATAPKTALVQWDSKQMMNYRAGFNERYDLRVFDSAPSGVKHDFPCAGCKDRVICGILWSCAECNGIYLCTYCYMTDEHQTNHNFKRINDSNSPPVAVPPRRASRKLDSYGIFQNACVKRGKDWTWDNQDCEGQGVVMALQGWSEESSRSVVSVEWANSATNVYRLGHRGKTDLFAVRPSKGWPYYVDHLPNFGEEIVERRLPIFAVGETVRVDVNTVRVQNLSEGHGQWHENMKHYIGSYGIVHRITENDDVRIIFPDRQKWTYNPKAINKVFRLNDKVMLTEDAETLKEYHGDQLSLFTRLRGKRGIITELRPDTCLHFVQFIGGHNHYVHANCLYAVDSNQHTNLLASGEDQQSTAIAAQLQQQQLSGGGAKSQPDTLMDTSDAAPLVVLDAPVPQIPTEDEVAAFFRALDQGNVDAARAALEKFPALINSEMGGAKALMRAANTGKQEMLQLFELFNANLNVVDADGDSPIHVAIKKNFLHLLPTFGRPFWNPILNANNNPDRFSPLHLCVKLGYTDAVKWFLSMPQIQCTTKDFEGNVPLHLAILNDKDEIAELLMPQSQTTMTFMNDDGHNPLHLACIKGKPRLIEKILQLKPELVNSSNKKGFAPVHLAAFQNQPQSLNVILHQTFINPSGRIHRNKDFNSYTALHLAVVKMHPKIVEILVEVGQLAAQDKLSLTEDSGFFTPLHMAVDILLKTGCDLSPHALFQLQQIDDNEFKMDNILALCGRCVPLAVCSYLIGRGADCSAKNKMGFSPIEMVATDPKFKYLEPTLTSFIFKQPRLKAIAGVPRDRFPGAGPSSAQPNPGGPSTSKINDVEGENCKFCVENKANVRYEPCNHIVYCIRCVHKLGAEIKKCFHCTMDVQAKFGPNGEIKPAAPAESPPDVLCQVCMERVKNVAPRCGHTMCRECSRVLKECPFCRGPMVEIRAVYL